MEQPLIFFISNVAPMISWVTDFADITISYELEIFTK